MDTRVLYDEETYDRIVAERDAALADRERLLVAARAAGRLTWTSTPPTEPGWYWVKHPKFPLEISEFSADEIEQWQGWYWEGCVWAGPIPEPEAAAGGTG